MAVGVIKQKYDFQRKPIRDRPEKEPEAVQLAERAQMNQAGD